MPLYDYACQQCGHAIEVMHGVNDTGPGTCDRCGGAMRKLLSTPAIVFKGSGWAKKDARSARPSGAKGATDNDADPGSAASDGAKRDGATGGDAGPSKSDTAGSDSTAKPAAGAGAAADT
jgi:putative FmdB family regulatory protein